MKILLAYAGMNGCQVPDAPLVARLEALARGRGHLVEHIVLPDRSDGSPQKRALPWQLLPIAAYGDALWAVNFPACVMRHASRRLWFTRADPFGIDPRAPLAALWPLIGGGDPDTSIVVSDGALAAALGLAAHDVEIELPVAGPGEAAPAVAAVAGSA
jgi:hypothetical protein